MSGKGSSAGYGLFFTRYAAASRLPFGLPQAGNPVARLPLAPLLEQFKTLEALEDIPFPTQSGGRAQTTML